jgi:ABC-2 type transport system permease protein
MLTRLRRTLVSIARSFLPQEREADAWIDADVWQTADEIRVGRVTRLLLLGALAHFLLCAVLVALGLFYGGAADLAGALVAGYPGAASEGWLALNLLVFANGAALLVLALGTMAMDLWVLPLGGLVGLANAALLALWAFWPSLLILALLGVAFAILWPALRGFRLNPVMVRELRGRMRGVRAFAIISIYLTLMGGFTILLYLIQMPVSTISSATVTGELGRDLFFGIVGIELVLILFITPALTAGAITGERERGTYDLLQTTLLAAPAFILGKLESALGYILLLILAAIPLQSVAFLFGGVSDTELVLAFLVLGVTSLALGAAGTYFSSHTERSMSATVRTYTLGLLIVLGVPVASSLLFRNAFSQVLSGLASGVGSTPLMEQILIYLDMLLISLNPATALLYSQQMLITTQQPFFVSVTLTTTGATVPVISPWVLLVAVYLAAAALFLLLAIRRLRRGGSG